jgi:cytochrome c556
LALLSWFATAAAQAPGDAGSHQAVKLSPPLLELLRTEMREIAAGVQGISVALAVGDCNSIRETSAKIRASYIMEKSLTPAQVEELEQALPARLKELDAEFHQRADKLGAAAAAHDAELASYHYARLLDSCVACHGAYARLRFPGFAPPAPAGPRHGQAAAGMHRGWPAAVPAFQDRGCCLITAMTRPEALPGR